MENAQQAPEPGSLSWRLSSHPITLLTFLFFRIFDFYYLKNIVGRRLVGLRWWNEVDANTGDGRWVFESLDPETGRQINATDKRFFWLALYAQPVLWVLLAIVALVSFEFIWLTLVGTYRPGQTNDSCANAFHPVIALVLTITNTLAFSRCDKFSQATGFASNAMYGSGLARNLAGGLMSSILRR
ncbi:golgi apparatus membrane protein-like protein tvp23 [Alternaria alternata]|nr:golgi apparatus membrane protein-like protein tvp23 [Alternaria alternata]